MMAMSWVLVARACMRVEDVGRSIKVGHGSWHIYTVKMVSIPWMIWWHFHRYLWGPGIPRFDAQSSIPVFSIHL